MALTLTESLQGIEEPFYALMPRLDLWANVPVLRNTMGTLDGSVLSGD